MAGARKRRQAALRIVAGAVAVGLTVLFILFVQRMMSLKVAKPERQVQTIQIIRPPPPPPPDQPPPPPPPPKVEEQIPQDKPQPTPDQPDQAPPDTLANDGPATAGGDAFGMHAGAGGAIGGTGTAPFAWYTNRMRDVIKDKLSGLSCIKSVRGSVETRIVVDSSGHVKHIDLLAGTGNPAIDSCVDKAISSITQLGSDPPPGMPEAVNLKVVF